MDKLDQAITETQNELFALREHRAQIERECDKLEAKLSAFRFAADVRPLAEPEAKRGRQAGAISIEWRKVLRLMRGNPGVELPTIAMMADHVGIKAEVSSIKDRMRLFEQRGYVSSDAHGRFRVTEAAVARFNLDKLIGDSDEDDVDD